MRLQILFLCMFFFLNFVSFGHAIDEQLFNEMDQFFSEYVYKGTINYEQIKNK